MSLLPVRRYELTLVDNGWILEYTQGAIDRREIYERFEQLIDAIAVLAYPEKDDN